MRFMYSVYSRSTDGFGYPFGPSIHIYSQIEERPTLFGSSRQRWSSVRSGQQADFDDRAWD